MLKKNNRSLKKVKINNQKLLESINNSKRSVKSVKFLTINEKPIKKKLNKKLFSLKSYDLKNFNFKENYEITFKTINGIENFENKTNQDNYFIEKGLCNNQNNILLGIIDGHGKDGEIIAEYVKKKFLDIFWNILKTNFKNDEIIKLIKYSFIKTNYNLINKSDIDTLLSGCTLSIVLIFENMIYSANVGDSEIKLIRNIQNNASIINLSKVHNPENMNEKKRILESGGEIRKVNKKTYDESPLRIWIKNKNYPGLMMTRCIGDKLARKIGVISSPYISIMKFNSNIKYIILGSDGLWDKLTDNELIELNKNNSVINAVQLSMLSKQKWLENNNYNDDVTCIVLKINN